MTRHAASIGCMTSPNPTHPHRANITAFRGRSTAPTNCTWLSSPSSRIPSTADVPQFLYLLTAREDHTWFDHLAAGNKLGSRSPAPLTGGWRRRVPAGLRRRCWQRHNRLKWRHFIPALTPGMPSFNLWTGVPGFDGLRSGVSHEILRSGTWATGQDDEIQSRAVATLAERSGVCIIYNKRAMDFWIHGADVKNRPVIRFMDLKFRGVLESGDNRLLVRNTE